MFASLVGMNTPASNPGPDVRPEPRHAAPAPPPTPAGLAHPGASAPAFAQQMSGHADRAHPGWVQPQPASMTQAAPFPTHPTYPPPPPPGPGFAPQGPPAPRRREPRFSREQIVAALLATAGIGVTLIGLVMLLAMAAREGLLTPPVRVGGGAALVVALAGTALWIRPRPGGRIGSVALLTTALAAGFFDVVAVTRIYSWIPLTAGLALALVVAAAGSLLAMRWNEKWLSIAIAVAVAALAPWLTGGVTAALVGFLVVLQVAGIAPEVAKGWDETAVARTAPAVLGSISWLLAVEPGLRVAAFATASIAAIGLLSGVLSGLTRPHALVSPIAMLISWAPLSVFAALSHRSTTVLVFAVMTVCACGASLVLRRQDSTTRLAAYLMTGASAVMLTFACSVGDWRIMPFFAVAVAGAAVHVRVHRTWIGWIVVGTLVLAVVCQGATAPFGDLFYRSRAAQLPTSLTVAGVSMIAVAVLLPLAVRARRFSADYVQAMVVAAGAAGVLGAAVVLITTVGADPQRFYLTHLVITVLALALAAAVLNAGLERPRHLGASMLWGLALVACALVKLFAFDLQYMGSMTKAFTFMAAGLVLLAAGTLYARNYALAVQRRQAASVSVGDADASSAGAH